MLFDLKKFDVIFHINNNSYEKNYNKNDTNQTERTYNRTISVSSLILIIWKLN